MSLPVIAITNQSTVLTDDQVKAVIPALQKQVTDDFRAYWDVDATLTFLPKTEVLTAGWWQIVIVDDPDQAGALGYHELSAQGTPLGKVFAKLDIENGQSWTCTLSHELLEMLGDPFIDTCKEAVDGKLYALEVSDAVEADELGYQIDGVLVSDFVTPRWFNSDVAGDRYSFKQNVKSPMELAPGGYISVLDPKRGWIQLNHQRLWRITGAVALPVNFAPGQMIPIETVRESVESSNIPEGSRRDRRGLSKTQWQRSVV